MKLGELCEVVRGSSPRPKGDPRFYGGSVPRLMVADVTRDGKYVTPKIDFLTEEGATRSRPMKQGDLVIAVSGNPGLPSILEIDACIHDGFVGLRNLDKTKVLVDYLYRYLLFFKEKIKNQAVGAIFKNLTTHQIAAIDLPLLPLEEQRRIATILDKADAVRRKRQEAVRLTEELLRSQFLEMFGDPVNNPKGWEVLPLGEISKVQGGLQVTSKRKPNPLEVPYLRVANVYRDRLVLDEIKMIRVTPSEIKRTQLEKGDLLIVEGHGNSEEIGRSSVWDGSISNCTHQNHLIRVRVNPTKAEPNYVSAFLNSSGGRRQLKRFGKTTSGLNTISASNGLWCVNILVDRSVL
ncbi:restriction endonuclease subunit S [Leptothoe sp. EHU-05/26/07-4]